MIRLCIFDMGGVLIRNQNICPELASYLGFDGIRTFADFGPDVKAALRSYDCGLTGEDAFWDVFSEVTGRSVDLSSGSLFSRFFHPVTDIPTENVISAIKKRGIRTVCGTNVPKEHFDKHNALGQYAVFDKVYTSFEMHVDKPDPEFFRIIMKAEGVRPDECFFTDDAALNVEAAAALGMKAFIYRDAHSLESDLRELGVL